MNVLHQVFLAEPLRDHKPAVTIIKEKIDKLSSELEKTSIMETDALISQAKAVQEKAGLTLAQVTKASMADYRTVDSKPIIKDGSRSGFKPPTITVPKFSGALEDWQAFWSAFERSIHQTEDFSKAAKLYYLREAMQDKTLYRRLSPIEQPENYYDEAVAELKKTFDKPKQMHLKYVMNILNMGQVQPTKAALNKCADIIRDSMDGLEKTKQTDARYIFSSYVASLLPPKLANTWAEKTSSSKVVLSVRDLVTFLKDKADQPYFHEIYSGSNHSNEKKPYKQKVKGSAHVAVAQPVSQPAATPPVVHQSNAPGSRGPRKPKGSGPNTCKYSCPSCSELHYAFHCSTFKRMTVPQRAEYVKSHSLCPNCLKPGHSPEECRSTFTCNVCQGAHSTFLHTNQPTPTPSPPVGTINRTTDAVQPDSSLHKKKLMMTCMAKATGPTGETMAVRDLLDSGANVSSVTTSNLSCRNWMQ